jgi:hypothetical protein
MVPYGQADQRRHDRFVAKLVPSNPHHLPHGLIAPPERVLEIVAAEKVKFAPTIFTAEAEERLKNDLTLQFYFDGLGHELLYRSTPDGPEVLAVGFDEIQQFRSGCPQLDQPKLNTWLP